MRRHEILTLPLALVLLLVAGCQPVEEPGKLLEPLPASQGLVAHATLDDSPIKVSDARRPVLEEQLAATAPAPAQTPAPTPEPTPEATSEPTPEVTSEPVTPTPAAIASTDEPTGTPEDGQVTAEATPDDPVETDPEPTPEGEPTPEAEADPSGSPTTAPVAAEATPVASPTPVETPSPAVSDAVPATPTPAALATPEPVPAEPTPSPVAEDTPAPSPEELLPDGPESDAPMIAALDSLERKEADPARVLVPEDLDEITAPVQKCVELPALQRVDVRDLTLVTVRWDGPRRVAILEAGGETHEARLLDLIGREGGRVTRIEEGEVVVSSIAVSPAGEAQIAVESIWPAP